MEAQLGDVVRVLENEEELIASFSRFQDDESKCWNEQKHACGAAKVSSLSWMSVGL
jgi:hypothetical protein